MLAIAAMPSILRDLRMVRKRGKLIRKAPRMLPPLNLESAYNRELQGYCNDLAIVTKQTIIPRIEHIVSDFGHLYPKHDTIHLDAFSDKIKEALRSGRESFGKVYTDQELEKMADRIGRQASGFNRQQLGRVLQAMIGVDVFMPDHFSEELLTGFVHRNVALIKTIPERYFSQVEELIHREVSQGVRASVIANEILGDKLSTTKFNASRIARDQVGKINSQFNSFRQQKLGIEGYTWQGIMDGRERDSHVALEGKYFTWESGGDDIEGNPGDAVLCRCNASPALERLMQQLEAA